MSFTIKICRTGHVCSDCTYSCLCKVYCSLLKSVDLMNLENTFQYLATISLLSGCQCLPQSVMCCFKELLCFFSILHSYIICSVYCAPSVQEHVGLSANLNLCRQDFVFPCPVILTINYGALCIFILNLCSTRGKNDLHIVLSSILSNCVCLFTSPFIFISAVTVVV